MEEIYLTAVQEHILILLIKGLERTEIAKGLNIKVSTLNSYIRDMNRNNECNLIQLVWMYSQIETNYKINKTKQL
jgi:DNA-binding CsgD family transcriptional regulator